MNEKVLNDVKEEIKESIEGIDIKDIDPDSNEPLPELNDAEKEVLKEALENVEGGVVKQAVEQHLYQTDRELSTTEKELRIPLLGKSTRFQIEGNDYVVTWLNEGKRRFTCNPTDHDTIPALDEKFMFAGNEYRVSYHNEKNNSFSCVPYVGTVNP